MTTVANAWSRVVRDLERAALLTYAATHLAEHFHNDRLSEHVVDLGVAGRRSIDIERVLDVVEELNILAQAARRAAEEVLSSKLLHTSATSVDGDEIV